MMPTIDSITISNFKGASKVKIDFRKHVDCPVFTLIGLNESGKTTLLEAISYFVTGDNAVSSLFSGTHSKSTIEGIIPIHRKAAFTDTISVTSQISLDDQDIQAAIRTGTNLKYGIRSESFPRTIDVG